MTFREWSQTKAKPPYPAKQENFLTSLSSEIGDWGVVVFLTWLICFVGINVK